MIETGDSIILKTIFSLKKFIHNGGAVSFVWIRCVALISVTSTRTTYTVPVWFAKTWSVQWNIFLVEGKNSDMYAKLICSGNEKSFRRIKCKNMKKLRGINHNKINGMKCLWKNFISWPGTAVRGRPSTFRIDRLSLESDKLSFSKQSTKGSSPTKWLFLPGFHGPSVRRVLVLSFLL